MPLSEHRGPLGSLGSLRESAGLEERFAEDECDCLLLGYGDVRVCKKQREHGGCVSCSTDRGERQRLDQSRSTRNFLRRAFADAVEIVERALEPVLFIQGERGTKPEKSVELGSRHDSLAGEPVGPRELPPPKSAICSQET